MQSGFEGGKKKRRKNRDQDGRNQNEYDSYLRINFRNGARVSVDTRCVLSSLVQLE